MLVRNLIAMILLIMVTSPVQASQTEEILDTLFEQLKTSSSELEAKKVENQIQSIWIEHDQEDINILMHKGVLAIGLNKFPLALQIFDLVITREPNFAEAWNKRALTYFLMENYEASIKDIQKALSLEPRHFSAISGLGFIYKKLGQYEEALEAFVRLSQIYPHFQGLEQYVIGLKKTVSAHRI